MSRGCALSGAAAIWALRYPISVLAEDRAPSCAEAEEIGQRHLLAIRHRRAGLERLEAALLGLLEGCREDRPDCALLRALMRPPAPGIR